MAGATRKYSRHNLKRGGQPQTAQSAEADKLAEIAASRPKLVIAIQSVNAAKTHLELTRANIIDYDSTPEKQALIVADITQLAVQYSKAGCIVVVDGLAAAKDAIGFYVFPNLGALHANQVGAYFYVTDLDTFNRELKNPTPINTPRIIRPGENTFRQ